MKIHAVRSIAAMAVLSVFALPAISQAQQICPTTHFDLKNALDDALGKHAENDENAVDSGGFGLDMWATVVDRDGVVCAVAFSGEDRHAQWPGSRVISAQKANTANAFSLDILALSTANLYSAVQPGGSLYGLQHSNPVDTSVGYKGPSRNYGQHNDPMVGAKIGGVNVFGGGLGLYMGVKVVGGVGVSGDTSCTDHFVAWRVRFHLGLEPPAGAGNDNILYDIKNGISDSGFGHPECDPPTPDPGTLPGAQ